MATGVGPTGSGIGGIVYNLAMQHMIEIRNVKWALITQFITSIVLSIFALLLTRTRGSGNSKPSIRNLRVFGRQVWACTGVWLVSVWVLYCTLLSR